MQLQEKLTLYNAVTKMALIFILGAIILFSLERISIHHLDDRLIKKKTKLIGNLNDKEVDSLLSNQQTFTDYNILKDEFIVLKALPNKKTADTVHQFITDDMDIDGEIASYRVITQQFKYKKKYYQLDLGITMTGIVPLKNSFGLYMLIVLVVSLTITLITDYAFTRFLLKPFYQIIDRKINKVNDPTTFNYTKINTSTNDFVLLDNSINGLMAKITNAILLEKQFIANVSHELLTPISVLNGRLENILASEELAIAHEEKITASLKTLSRLKAIINSLLLISKVENNQFLKNDKIQIRKILSDIYEDLQERIEDKNLTYFDDTKVDFKFMGNEALIHILLTNIINNAIKYSNSTGKITIEDQLTRDTYQLTIVDEGVGMEKETLRRAFHRFEREDHERTTGSGLGLAIANSIAKFHQIGLSIASEKQKGTVVKIKFNRNNSSAL